MKIVFYNLFNEAKNGEAELILRIRHAMERCGHTFLIADRDGYIENECSDKGKHAEYVHADFLCTCNTLDMSLVAIPDVFSVFMHWAPLGFMNGAMCRLTLGSWNVYDCLSCTGEANSITHVVDCPIENISLTGTSISKDYIVAPRKMEKRKLFYIGINYERALDKMRYGKLLGELDRTGQLEIYGPKRVYGKDNLWAGFDSYRGEISFDGHSVIRKISEAGVCLALNSPMHNDADMVSARTYEGATAGAVIILDDNEFVHRYFGDSVFYIGRDLSEEEASEKVMDILKWVNQHPEESYSMACRAQKAFLENLTLEKMISDQVESVKRQIEIVHDTSRQFDTIDIICFVNKAEEFEAIQKQLKKQFYQNIHLIVVCDKIVYDKLKIVYPYDYVVGKKDERGRAFLEATKVLKGPYFMFMDGEAQLHARHIYKNYQVLNKREELFVYSGCYLRRTGQIGRKYIVMNNKPILRDEFLLFSNTSCENIDWHYRDRQTFYIETIFSRASGLFKREILRYIDDDEMCTISNSVHLYLACCSLIKANKPGRFTYALTTGYWGDSVEEAEGRVFGYFRRHWVANGRSAKTFIKEFNEVFFKYTFESNPNHILPRNFNGEITWFDEMPPAPPQPEEPPISWKRRLARLIKKIIPKPIKEIIKKCEYA